MKIITNYALIGGNFGHANSYNNGLNNSKQDLKSAYDSVTFTARGPKGFKKAQNAVQKKVVKPVKHHIKNSLAGEFNRETQAIMENLHQNLKEIHSVYENLSKTNPNKLAKLKKDYKPLVIIPKKQGLTFKMDDGKTLTIMQNRNKPALVRFEIEQDGQTRYILLDGYDKVVSNINQKTPAFLPPKFRYMTVEEIHNSNVKAYINFANAEVEKFRTYLTTIPKSTRTKAAPETAKVAKNTTLLGPKVNNNAKDEILALFTADNPELPKHLKPILSSNNNLLGFSLNLENGSELKVMKRISPQYGADLRYLSFIESTQAGTKKYLTIDMLNGDILKTSVDGKPVVVNGMLHSYTPAELKQSTIKAQFSDYAQQIFKTVEGVETPEAVIVQAKKLPAPKKEVSIEDFEDINISKLIAKEVEAEEAAKSAVREQVSEAVSEVAEPVKHKRGRRKKSEIEATKVESKRTVAAEKTPEVEQGSKIFGQDMVEKLAKLKQDAVAQATGDAKVFAQTYFETFIEQFQLSLKSKMDDFSSKFGEIFKSFGKHSD